MGILVDQILENRRFSLKSHASSVSSKAKSVRVSYHTAHSILMSWGWNSVQARLDLEAACDIPIYLSDVLVIGSY